MKRITQHILFWLFYIALCMNMEYLWVSKVLPDMKMETLLKGMFLSAGITSLPEIVFAYYVIYIGYERLTKNKKAVLQYWLEIIAALIVSLLLIRLLSFYSLKYWAYEARLAEPVLWDVTIMWRSLIYLGFSTAVALSLHLSRQQLANSKREKELVQEKSNVELRLLRSQLHPHFLFNTLNNIYALARKRSELAADTVMKLSELLDFMLYRTNTETIPIVKEINFLEDYIDLEKIRYSNKLSIEFLKDIQQEQASIAPFLLLPLVENAFKHGTGEARKDSFIHIEITERNSQLHFVIQNNFEPVSMTDGKEKLGLQNVKRRLELLYRDYTFNVTADANNFKVVLFINLESYGKT